MTDAFIEQLRPLGFEKYASRLTRIVGNATQVVVGGDQVRRGLAPDETGAVIVAIWTAPQRGSRMTALS